MTGTPTDRDDPEDLEIKPVDNGLYTPEEIQRMVDHLNDLVFGTPKPAGPVRSDKEIMAGLEVSLGKLRAFAERTGNEQLLKAAEDPVPPSARSKG